MKKINLLMLIIVAIITFTSCEKENIIENNYTTIIVEDTIDDTTIIVEDTIKLRQEIKYCYNDTTYTKVTISNLNSNKLMVDTIYDVFDNNDSLLFTIRNHYDIESKYNEKYSVCLNYYSEQFEYYTPEEFINTRYYLILKGNNGYYSY